MTDDTPTIRQAMSVPPEDAIEAFRRRDELKVSVSWRDLQPEEHARAFTVAKMARVELLATVKESLDRALAEGKTFEMWQADIQPELQKAGWWGLVQDRAITGTDDAVFVGERRLRTIFRTNMRVSHAAGAWDRHKRAKGRRPYLRYSAVLDSRTRPQHARWNGIILPVDHEFWNTHFPPNGWNCRCAVVGLSEADLQKRGWKVTTEEELARLAPMEPIGRMPFGPRGARVDRPKLPAIDHGWDYNVGAESILGIVEKAATVIIRARAAGLEATAETLLAQLSNQLSDDMMALLLRLIDGIEPASMQWQDEIAGARKRRRKGDDGGAAGVGAETRAKLSRIAQLRNRIMGRFADEAELTGREAARLAHTRQWIADTMKDGSYPAAALDVGNASPRLIGQIEGLGLKVHRPNVMFEHGHTRHMFTQHGGASEYNRGQVPITADDVHAVSAVMNRADRLSHVTGFRGMHASSPPRLMVSSEVGDVRHDILFEIQRKGLVVRDMWKVQLG